MHRERRGFNERALPRYGAVVCVPRRPATDVCATVDLRLRDSADLVGAERGGHKSLRKSFSQVGELLRFVLNHDGLHLSAADGGTTMPELAQWVQVRMGLRRADPSGLRSGPQIRRSRTSVRSPLLTAPLGYVAARLASSCRRSLKQEERRTKATPEPPPRGHDVAHGRRSLSGARRLCCHRVARVGDPRWRYFGRQPDAHASFEFFVRQLRAAFNPTPSFAVLLQALAAY